MISVLAVALADGSVIADLTAHLASSVVWTRAEHGPRDLSCTIYADPVDRINWLARVGHTEIVLRSQYGERLWSGRLERVEPDARGVGLYAYGHWAALDDVLYTGLWSDADVESWDVLTSNDLATVADAIWTSDRQGRLYVAPTVTNAFGDADYFVFGYIAPSGGQRQLTDLDFDYTLTQAGDTDWRVSIDRCDSSWTTLGNIGTITAAGSGNKNYSFSGCDRVAVTFYRNNATPAALSGDAGTVFFEMTNVRIATSSSVTTSGIVAAMAAYTSGVNANHLSSIAPDVATTSDDLQNYLIEDERPRAVIADLLTLSDANQKFYEAGVDAYRRLYLYERLSRGVTYIADVGEMSFSLALDGMENSIYATYLAAGGVRTLRTDALTDTDGIGRLGMTRQGHVSGKATNSLTTAEAWRRDALASRSNPQPSVRHMALRGITRTDGAAARFYALKYGDRLRVAGLPLYAARALGELVIGEVEFDSRDGGTATVTLLDRVTPLTAITYSPLAVYATAEGGLSQWTANTGTKIAAVDLPDDDATTYISSSTASNKIQRFSGYHFDFVIPGGATVTQVDITYRAKRGGAINADFVVGYSFTTTTGTQTGTSGTLTSTSSWAGGTYTHSSLSALWNGGFYFYIQNTQVRDVLCTSLYATITYTNPA